MINSNVGVVSPWHEQVLEAVRGEVLVFDERKPQRLAVETERGERLEKQKASVVITQRRQVLQCNHT